MKLASVKYSLILVLLLFLTPQSPLQVGAADVTPPMVNNLTFSQTTAGPNDIITVSTDISDDQSGVSYADAEIRYYNTTCLCSEYKAYVYLDPSQGFTGTFTVNPFWPEGMYYINSIYAEDTAGNYGWQYNGTDFTSPELIVSGTTPDYTPPTVSSVTFSQSTAGPNDIITVSADITDDLSGVSYADVQISYYNTSCLCSQYKTYAYLDPSQGFTGTFVVNEYWPAGLYFIDYMYVEDNANNYRSLFNGTDFQSPYLTITGTTPDLLPPVVNSIGFDRSDVTGGEIVNVFLNATDDLSGIDYADASLYYYNTTCLCSEYMTYVYLDPSTGFTGSFEVNLFWPTGIYYIEYIYTQDKANNYGYDYNGTDFISPELQVTSVDDDFTTPTLVGLGFAQTEAPADGQVTLTAILSDEFSGIQNVSAELEVTGVGVEINNIFTVQLEGDRFGSIFETTIQLDPATYPAGSQLTVNRVWGSDMGGNSFNFEVNIDFTSVVVSITQPIDSDPPQLLEVGFNQAEVKLGESLEIFVHTFDEISGVSYVMIDLLQTRPDGSQILYGLELTQDPDNLNRWSIFVPIDERFGSGDLLYIDIVLLRDFAGNEIIYFDGPDFTSQGIKVIQDRGFQEIFVDVFDDQGFSVVNEEVHFEVLLSSTFDHDMIDVTLHVRLETPSGSFFDIFIENLDLPANSEYLTAFTHTFDEVGQYRVSFVLIDDIGTEWANQFHWEVVEEGSTRTSGHSDDTTNDETETSDDTKSDTNNDGNNSTDDSTAPPGLPVPGFELLFVIPIIATLSILRRKLNIIN